MKIWTSAFGWLLLLLSFALIFGGYTGRKVYSQTRVDRPMRPLEMKKLPSGRPPGGDPTAITPAILHQLHMPPNRSALFNSLLSNRFMRQTLESYAYNAGMRVNELAVKNLSKEPVIPVPTGRRIDQLNWDAGIKISLIKNNPLFFNYASQKDQQLGKLWYYGIPSLTNDNNKAADYVQSDTFVLDDHARLELCLPAAPAPYIITVMCFAPPESVILQDSTGEKSLNVVKSSSVGWSALENIKPVKTSTGYGFCTITVNISGTNIMGGIIITRL